MTLLELYVSYENDAGVNTSPRNRLYNVFMEYFALTRNEAKLLFYNFLHNIAVNKIEKDFGIKLYNDELKEIQKLINLTYLAEMENFSKETNVNITVNGVKDSAKFDTKSYSICLDKVFAERYGYENKR